MRNAAIGLILLALASVLCWGEPTGPSAPARPGVYLGVTLASVPPDGVAALKLKDTRGALISAVDQDAPAARAGLKERDVVMTFDGQPVQGPDDVRRLMREKTPGSSVALGVSRYGAPVNIKVQLAARTHAQMPSSSRPKAGPALPSPPVLPQDLELPQFSMLQFWSRNGLLVEDLTPQLGEYFGVRKGQGVLVRSVEKGSPADAAGLRAGDVIVKVNGVHVACSSEWRHTLSQLHGTVSVGIVREKREQTLSLKLPERRNSGALVPFGSVIENLTAQLDILNPGVGRALDSSSQAMRSLQRYLEDVQERLIYGTAAL